MKVIKVKQILNDPTMSQLETNFKVYKKGNNERITVAKLYDEFIEFKDLMMSFVSEQRNNWKEQRNFNESISQRIDNLVKKNNLEE